MMSCRCAWSSVLDRSEFAGFRFPPDVIAVAVRCYLRYGLSYRDVKQLLAERGVVVDHVTVYRWVQRFTRSSSTLRDRVGTRRRPLVRRRDLREGLPSLVLFVPGHRPVRSGDRRAAGAATGRPAGPAVLRASSGAVAATETGRHRPYRSTRGSSTSSCLTLVMFGSGMPTT
jgi:hypothetical protein